MVTHKRIQQFYTILIPGVPANMSRDDFEKTRSDKPRKPFSDYKELIAHSEAEARKIILDMDEFSFDEFEKKYFGPQKVEKDFFQAIEAYVKELTIQERVGTASTYISTLHSLKRFKEAKKLKSILFNDVTIEFLNTWEKWMISEGNALTTVGIYARNIRAILNKAKAAGLMKPDHYPFGSGKYEIPASSNVKKALTITEVGKIYNYRTPAGSPEGRAHDLWIFSYLCNGINVKDIARLKYKNISNDALLFVRAKTERKQRQNLKQIEVPLSPEIKAIIKRIGNENIHPNQYVFPILREGLTPEKERALIQQATKTINKYIKRIVTALKLKKDVTTYTARHSYATVLKRSGATIEYISESLGHSNISTTENYLASFEMETKKKMAQNLLKFKR